MKPTPIRRILWVIAILLVLVVLMVGLAQAQAVPPRPTASQAMPPQTPAQITPPQITPTASTQPLQVTDDRGKVVRFARTPQRIVSLLPSLSETVCALEQCHRLVGVDGYSNWPEQLTRLPQLGGGLDPNIEAIVALRPDVVLMATSSRAAARLESLGVSVVALEPKSHADVQRVMGTIGQVLAVPDAQRVWRHIDAAVQAAAQSVPPAARGQRVYFEVNRGPYAAGMASFMGETLTRLGARNIVPASLGPFPKLNPEFVVRADPDLIMVGARGAEGLADRPGWARMRAVRENRLCVFPVEESDVLVRPGPRMAEGARIMARCLVSMAAIAPTAPAATPVSKAIASTTDTAGPSAALKAVAKP